jgi:LmbE family N-acetylglucosaminyl deacetylase
VRPKRSACICASTWICRIGVCSTRSKRASRSAKSCANIGPSWYWVSARRLRWHRPTIGRPCRLRLTKWDEYFDHLPVHTVSTQLYYTLAFASLGLPPAAGHLVVDIGDTIEAKLAAIRCYATQFPPAKEHIFERVRAVALNQGTAAGYSAGELFASPRTLGTRDLMHFLFGLTPADEPRKPDVR